jgi:hypothetical protein
VAQVAGGVLGRCEILALRWAGLLTPAGRMDRLTAIGTGRALLAAALRGRGIATVCGRHRFAPARRRSGGTVLGGTVLRSPVLISAALSGTLWCRPVLRGPALRGTVRSRTLLGGPVGRRDTVGAGGPRRTAAVVPDGWWLLGARPRWLVRTGRALRRRGSGVRGTPDYRAPDAAVRLGVATTTRPGAGG